MAYVLLAVYRGTENHGVGGSTAPGHSMDRVLARGMLTDVLAAVSVWGQFVPSP